LFYKKRIRKLEKRLKGIENQLKIMSLKDTLKEKDYVFKFKNAAFRLPDYSTDFIERSIAIHEDFYESKLLNFTNSLIGKGAVILDVGANIGNHSIFWGLNEGVSKVYSFEPVKETFDKLKKNVELNNLSDKVEIYNVAIGERATSASIESFSVSNTGANSIVEDQSGSIRVISLDSMKFDRIDLVKIDVEGFEVFVLKGMLRTLREHRPTIIIESFEERHKEVCSILKSIGYENLGDKIKGETYIFK